MLSVFSIAQPYSRNHQWRDHIAFHFLIADYTVEPQQHVTFSSSYGDDSPKSLALGQVMMISKTPWWQGFPVWTCCAMSDTFILCGIRGMMCGRVFSSEHHVQYWQSRCQEELCFGAHNFWGSLNPFINCQDLFSSWDVTGVRSFVSLTPGYQRLPSRLPRYFDRDSTKDNSHGECSSVGLVLSWLGQGLLYGQSHV